MKKLSIFAGMMLAAAALSFSACGGSSDSSSDNDSSYYEDYEDGSVQDNLRFNSTRDVYMYLNGKTFSGDGLSIRFYNEGRYVDVNGTNMSTNVRVSDIGVNDNGVAYATVQVPGHNGGVTTFALLAVEGRAQLVDPNDGSVYEY